MILEPDVERLLLRGERLRRTSGEHPAGLVKRLARRSLQLLGLYLATQVFRASWFGALLNIELLGELGVPAYLEPIPGFIDTVCGYLTAVVCVLAVLDVLRWRLTLYALTDQRVLQIYGVLDRVVVDMPLDTVIDTATSQSLIGRGLDYGDLLIRTPTAVGNQPLEYLREPVAFKQAVERARQTRMGFGTPRSRGAAEGPPRGVARGVHPDG